MAIADIHAEPSPTGRWGARARSVLIGFGVLGLEVLVGAAIASSHAKYVIFAIVGISVIAFVWRFPLAGAILGLILSVGILDPGFFEFRLVGRTTYGYEVVLAVLLARAALRPQRDWWGGRAGGALALFALCLVFSTGLAISEGHTSLYNATFWGRSFDALAIFWVVVRLFPDRRSLRVLLIAGLVLGALSGVVGAILAVTGDATSVFQESGNQGVVASAGSLLRVRMPGLGIGFMLLWLLLYETTRRSRFKLLWWTCLPCILIDILVSQNRNMWVSGVVAFALVAIIAGPRVRGRLTTGLAIVIAAVAILIVAPTGGVSKPSPLQPLITRASTVFEPSQVRHSSSASDRDYENRHGWATATHHLLIGIGAGVPYGAFISDQTPVAPYAITPRLFLQNQYLYILVITGIPGLLAFLAFLGFTLREAARRGAPPESRMLGVGVFALMLTAVVMLSFTDATYLTALGLVCGVIVALGATASDDESVTNASLLG